MTKLSILLLIASLISCTKNNITIKTYWRVQEGHDINTYNHATFCFAKDYGVIDTVELDNTAEYDSAKFGMHVGSIVFHSRVETGVKGMYQRSYCQLLEQIN